MINIFGDLSTEFFRLIDAKDVHGALHLVMSEGGRFPEEDWHVTEWRVSAAAACGEDALALDLLRAGVERGLWYPAYRFDDDFARLRENPEFQRLLAICAEREQAAANTPSNLLIFDPPNQLAHSTLIVPHRNHGCVAHCKDKWISLRERGWRLAMPQSSQVMGPDIHIWNDRAKAVSEVLTHYPKMPLVGDVMWAGHMTGGDVALRTAMSGQVQARGVIAISPVTPSTDHLIPLVDAARERDLRVYIFIGERDRRCFSGAQRLADFLQAHGVKTRFDVRPDYTFGIPDDFPAVLDEAIKFIVGE